MLLRFRVDTSNLQTGRQMTIQYKVILVVNLLGGTLVFFSVGEDPGRQQGRRREYKISHTCVFVRSPMRLFDRLPLYLPRRWN